MAWAVPQINYARPMIDTHGMISSIGDSFQESMDRRKQNRMEGATKEAFAGGIPMRPDGSPDYAAMATSLFQAGNVDTGLGLTRLAETQAQTGYSRAQDARDFGYRQEQDQWDRGFQQQQLEAETAGAQSKPPEVAEFFNEQTGQPEKRQWNPQARAWEPVGGVKAPGKGQTIRHNADGSFEIVQGGGMPNSTVSKEIFEADDAVQSGQSVIAALDRAIELNEKAYSGPAAGARGYGASLLGIEGGRETEELKNIVAAQTLDQLKAIFGGMPTEGERKVLMDIQGSVNQSPEVRKGIYERARVAAQRRIAFNKRKAEGLRSGTYFGPGGADATPMAAPRQQSQPAQDTGGRADYFNPPNVQQFDSVDQLRQSGGSRTAPLPQGRSVQMDGKTYIIAPDGRVYEQP